MSDERDTRPLDSEPPAREPISALLDTLRAPLLRPLVSPELRALEVLAAPGGGSVPRLAMLGTACDRDLELLGALIREEQARRRAPRLEGLERLLAKAGELAGEPPSGGGLCRVGRRDARETAGPLPPRNGPR